MICAAIKAVSFTSIAQLGIGTNDPHASAALEISSTSKGLLIPRMTTVERDAIVEPVEGLMVYVKGAVGVAGSFMYYDGANWKELFRGGLTTPRIISGVTGNPLDENSGEEQVVYTILVNTDITGEITYFLEVLPGTNTELLRLGHINKNDVIFLPDPNFEDQETYSFKVQAVSSEGEKSLWEEVSFSIRDKNEPPEITSIAKLIATQDLPYNYTVTASDEDEDDQLTFTAETKPNWLEITDATSTSATLEGVPGNDDVGNNNDVSIIVTDEKGVSVEHNFTIVVDNVNDLPTIEGTPSFTVIENEKYIFNALGADDDANTTLTYSIDNRPDWAQFNNVTGALIGTPLKRTANGDDSKTVYNDIKIGVSDGVGPEVYLPVFKITVVDNSDPVITIDGPNPMSINNGEEYTEYGVTDVDTGETYDTNYGEFNPDTPNLNSPKEYTITYTATDAALNIGIATRTVVVQPEPIEVKGYAGRIWMDRNLGAKDKAENQTENNPDSYGHQYQWGRDSDGHESREHQVTTPIPLAIGAEGNDFVTGSSSWLESIALNRWNEIEDYKPYKGEHDPCPIGYRLPSKDEVDAEVDAMNLNDDKWNSKLKLPFTGWRTIFGVRSLERTHGRYWTGTADGTLARAFQITRIDEENDGIFVNRVSVFPDHAGFGYSVRCIQQLPDENQEHED